MGKSTKLAELRRSQRRTDALRKELAVSSPGEITFLADYGGSSDRMVIVEADGFGRATTSLVEGNYPVDYLVIFEKTFPSEDEAEGAASDVAFRRISPDLILGPPS